MQHAEAGTLTEIRKEAAEWLIRMDCESTWDRKEFVVWLKSSPLHMDEFLSQSALWAALHDAPPRVIDIRELFKEVGSVVDWPERPPAVAQHQPLPLRRSWRLAGLAAVLVLGVSGLRLLLQDNAEVIATAVGEQRSIRLSDRSVIHLNTDSRVEVRFTQKARELHLVKGEALFIVQRDTSRPFRVRTEGISVEALGTQFNVRRRASDTVVSVVEGSVSVTGGADAQLAGRAPTTTQFEASNGERNDGTISAVAPPITPVPDVPRQSAGALAVLTAGEQARVTADGIVEERPIEDITAATAWRQRKLVFDRTPLSVVVAEVARYNTSPQLLIEGDELQARQLNGVFAADDPEALIQFLARDAELSVVRNGDTVLIRYR